MQQNLQDDIKKIAEGLQRYAERINADIYFRDFRARVKNNEVRENGKDKLLNIIDDYILHADNCHKQIEPGTVLYRARIIHLEDKNPNWGLSGYVDGKLVGFDEAGSREAPLGMTPEGRNNISGVSYLYLSDSAETACAEVKPTITHLLSVADFQVNAPVNIIDFSENPGFIPKEESIDFSLDTLFGRIMEQYFLPVVDPVEYKATQIITDHIRKTGIDGIAYRSFYNESGKNYTIFNSERRRFEFMGSRIVSFQSESRSFWDYNNKTIITAQSMGPNKYDQKISDQMIDAIRSLLNRTIDK